MTDNGSSSDTIRPSDPLVIIAGIRRFGLASDGSDLRDLEAALRATQPAAPAWKCLAPSKAACAWPDCGCDPEATKVIAALVDAGWGPEQPAAPTGGEEPDTDEFTPEEQAIARAIVRLRELFERAPYLQGENQVPGCGIVTFGDLKVIQQYAEQKFEAGAPSPMAQQDEVRVQKIVSILDRMDYRNQTPQRLAEAIAEAEDRPARCSAGSDVLLPCPFCGNQPHSHADDIQHNADDLPYAGQWLIECNACPVDCNTWGASKDLAIKYWNTRHVAQPSLKLGDTVEMNERSPYHADWRGCRMKVVSLRIDPDGNQWVSVIEGDQRHRGNGVYDGETTDIEAEHLSLVSSTDQAGGK